ncbi:Hypothetical protein, putative [Bodo saltans]|uniref:Uncharacterized protein n=1 Tax=Bodo saltans TaxID=75058 RepID=A0A0S4JJY8_BODSA|nr:Hypothetical protein, putative [Bodo saltans]|eukprot:CUG89307.1 Hypothetical protein, putative [Bodo saltans]
MVLFAVSVSQAKVITVDDDYRLIEDDRTPHLHGFSNFYSGDPQRAVALAPKYDAHFIPVKHYGFTHPRTGQVTPTDVDYQATEEHEATAHELVISSHHRCVPIAVT